MDHTTYIHATARLVMVVVVVVVVVAVAVVVVVVVAVVVAAAAAAEHYNDKGTQTFKLYEVRAVTSVLATISKHSTYTSLVCRPASALRYLQH